jgi:hypothetical protein
MRERRYLLVLLVLCTAVFVFFGYGLAQKDHGRPKGAEGVNTPQGGGAFCVLHPTHWKCISPPAPAVIENISDGQVLSGHYDWQAFPTPVNAIDDPHVRFLIDGQSRCVEYVIPFDYCGDGNDLDLGSLSSGPHLFRVEATWKNGTVAFATATATVEIAPCSVTSVTIIANGDTLTADTGGCVATTFQWRRCDSAGANCSDISGATSSTYPLTSADSGHALRVVADGVTSSAWNASSSSAILRTGWTGVTLPSAAGQTGTGTYQTFSGTDSLTGQNFTSTDFYGSPWHMHGLIWNGTGSAVNFTKANIETVTGPSGSPEPTLRLSYLGGASLGPSRQMIFESVSPFNTNVRDYYMRCWIKFNSDIQAQANTMGGNYWRTFWQFKSWDERRTSIYLYNHHAHGLDWYIQDDNAGWNKAVVPDTIFYGGYGNDAAGTVVPVSDWMYVEIYLHRSTASDGRFYFAVNGTEIVNLAGANMISGDEVAILPHSILYSNYHDRSEQWVNGIEVYPTPPCATLPCGPPTA